MGYDILLLMSLDGDCSKIYSKLRRSGMNVFHINITDDVKAELVSRSPAFILLDFKTEGADLLLHRLSSGFFRPYPFIIVSADYSNGAERAAMLSRGADACVDYPINSDEVLAIINAVLRRERRVAGLNLGRLLPCIEYKDLRIDPLRRVVTKAGEHIWLTAKDFDVLCVLAHHAGIVLTKEEIYKSVWGEDYRFASSNVPRSVSSLRQKIGLDRDGKDYIQTIFRVGYRFGNIE